MNKIETLTTAFEFIEDNLQSDIKTADVAKACYCSKSTLEKLFRCLNNISLHDYVIRRRMMLAARKMVNEPDTNLLEIALACGYSSNESFSRAFKSVWNLNPSEFKEQNSFFELFPRLYPPIKEGDNAMRKNVDISELYDLFVERHDCYFVCCDIKGLIPINEISYKAGDLAIIECMNRMNKEAGNQDIVFRIGGDEFVMLTNSKDCAYAEQICDRIKSYNTQPFIFENIEIPLTLHVSCCKYESKNINYDDLYQQLKTSIDHSK
ncbi:MAG: helix-turn-helix domain-containing protein [Lachnospiraceae bacterium]